MIMLIDKSNRDNHAAELQEAYRLRHRIFVEEAKWEALRRRDGLEHDRFDDEHAVEMLLYEGERLIGYQRMLPTTRPYLLTEIYPQLCDGAPPSSPAIFEWTRFAVEPDYRGEKGSLGRAGAELVHAYVEWGIDNDVEAVVVELAPMQMLKFIQCHFMIRPLGLLQRVGDQDIIAVLASFDRRTLKRLQGMLVPPTAGVEGRSVNGSLVRP